MDAYGFPYSLWGEVFEGGVAVRRVPDWLAAVPLPLGWVGCFVLDLLLEGDPDFHLDYSLGQILPPHLDHSMIAAVARAAAAGGRIASGAGPVLDSLGAELHLTFALSRLGDHVEVTPEDKREEALKWAHAQGPRGTRGTYHHLLSEGYRWPNMEKDCLRVAKECLNCQRFTAQRHGFHPLRSATADLRMDGLAMDLAQMKTSTDGRNYILVVVDLCTRFTWLYATANKASDSITACLRELCAILASHSGSRRTMALSSGTST